MADLAGVIHEIIARRTAAAKGVIADRSADVSVAERGHQRMGVLLERMSNPQWAYQTIHIAGSKGKGTTAHLAAAILTEFGIRTGLYTSPHLISWNERIRIDGVPISDAKFLDALNRAEREIIALEETGLGPFNAFELVTATAFLAFYEAECEVAVIEVGLGGRFDSTNHLRPTSTAITTIEAEHVDILGPDLQTIAWNKAGIMRPGVPVVIQEQVPEVIDYLVEAAREIGAPPIRQNTEDWSVMRDERKVELVLRDGSERVEVDLALPGIHNAANFGAAVMATRFWQPGAESDDALFKRVAASANIPGRFTVLHCAKTGQSFVLDVAHTRESIGHLIESVAERFGSHPTTYVVNLANDKPWHDILERLLGHADRLVFPEMHSVRAVSAEALANDARKLGFTDVTVSPLNEVPLLVREDGRPIVVTGSFGIVGDVLGRGVWVEPRDL